MSNISQFLANPTRQLRYVLTGVGAASSTATWTAPSSIAVNEVLVVCVGGGGGYGGSLQNILPFFQIMQSSGTSLGGNSASGPSVSAVQFTLPPGPINYVTGGGGARNSATNGSIGYGGGGGVGGDISSSGTQSSGPSPGASASVGAVFVLY